MFLCWCAGCMHRSLDPCDLVGLTSLRHRISAAVIPLDVQGSLPLEIHTHPGSNTSTSRQFEGGRLPAFFFCLLKGLQSVCPIISSSQRHDDLSVSESRPQFQPASRIRRWMKEAHDSHFYILIPTCILSWNCLPVSLPP